MPNPVTAARAATRDTSAAPSTVSSTRPAGLADDAAYRALESRDVRFDGRVWFGVTTTGIYCRPVCPAQTPKRTNVRFFASPSAAVASGFRACRRCRPDSAPGTREWDHRGDLVSRALRGIAEGAVDESGVSGLARRLHVSERHLHRTLNATVGAGPLQLATSRRAQTARLLIDQTGLPLTDIAYAAGFASIRQFNDVMLRQFGVAPSQLRRRQQPQLPADSPDLVLRLNYREPFDTEAMGGFLAARTLRGVEEHIASDSAATSWSHRRALRLRHCVVDVVVAPVPRKTQYAVRVRDIDLRDIAELVARIRRWLDLDADPASINSVLAADSSLRPLVESRPGLRVSQTPDTFEGIVRTIVGQQISVGGALTLLARVVATVHSRSGEGSAESAKHAEDSESAEDTVRIKPFPRADELATYSIADWRTSGFTGARAETLKTLCGAVAAGDIDLDGDADRDDLCRGLGRIKGVGPWTIAYVRLRVLTDPDAFPATDLVVRRNAEAIGIRGPELVEHALRWQPWRAYAATQLWNHDPTQSASSGRSQ